LNKTPLATLAAPAGLATALQKRQAAIGMTDVQLYAKAGLTASDWTTFQSALAAIDPSTFLKFTTALGVFVSVEESSIPADVIGRSFGPSIQSRFGDLS
jgi:hypothetical protein